MGWTVHPLPPCSPDFAYCDLYISGSLQDTLQEYRCADDKLKHSLREGMRRFSEEFCTTGIQLLTQNCKKYVDNERYFIKKNHPNCVNDVICKFRYNCWYSFLEKYEALLSYPPPLVCGYNKM